MKPVYLDEETRAIADLTEVEESVRTKIAGIPDPGDRPLYMLTRISVPQSARGKGKGSGLLRQILQDADEEGVVLALGISSSGGLSVSQLREWYGRYGFQRVPNSPLLVRYPKGTRQ